MNTTKGTSAASIAINTTATLNGQYLYFSRWVSPLLTQGQTSISANTWTFCFGASESDLSANFPNVGTDVPVYAIAYVWRPSTGAKVGQIADISTSSTVDEGATTSAYAHICTFTGSAVSNVQAGDVICFEILFGVAQAAASSYTDTIYYDGTTIPTENQQTSDVASYIETPQDLTFYNQVAIALPTETLSIVESRARLSAKSRTQTTETLGISEPSGVTRGRGRWRPLPTEILSITEQGPPVFEWTEAPRWTRHKTYWRPLRPRIKIYALTDLNYATPLYSYDPFTDVGSDNKPVSLHFTTETSNAGPFALEIDNSNDGLDIDLLTRGNRVVIECSKDGSHWNYAFKGLVRGAEHTVFGASGDKTLTLTGYSYMIRLNERVANFAVQSAINSSTGQYIRTDTTMNTNNLVFNLMDDYNYYAYLSPDLYTMPIIYLDHLLSSPINNWIPRIDGGFATVSDALKSILEYSNSAATVDFTTDQLELYNAEQVTSNTGIFLITDQPKTSADQSDNVMYPIEPFTYEIGYNQPDAANRLIASIGNYGCVPASQADPIMGSYAYLVWFYTGSASCSIAENVTLVSSPLTGLRIGLVAHGNCSSQTSLTGKLWYYEIAAGPDTMNCYGTGEYEGYMWVRFVYHYRPTTYVGQVSLYRNGVPDTPFPDASTGGDVQFWAGMEPTAIGPVVDTDYILGITPGTTQTASAKIGWIMDRSTLWYMTSTSNFSGWGSGNPEWDCYYDSYCGTPVRSFLATRDPFRIDYNSTTFTPTFPCGGLPSTADADPVQALATDYNMIKRTGFVERALADIPVYVKTKQTMDEYMFAQIYASAKPRFTFDFPAVTVPSKLPKAGDIIAHCIKNANLGTKSTPVQTGMISGVDYEFTQDESSVLGLTKLKMQTTGIRKGYY